MTNLSKELCEICGMPYIKTEDNCRVYDNEGELCEQYVYKLNFEQPENFVKLMELRVDGLSGGTLTLMGILNNEYWLSDRQDYIEFLYKYYIPALTPLRQDELKQKIRETEWVYGWNQLSAFKRNDRLRSERSFVQVCGLPKTYSSGEDDERAGIQRNSAYAVNQKLAKENI